MLDLNKILKYATIFHKKTAAGNLDQWARGIIIQAFQKVMSRQPTIAEAQLVQAVAKLESNYGKSWKGEGSDSHNWGAIQSHNPKDQNFSHNDTRPTKDGKSITYKTNFRSYPDDVSGAVDVVFNIYKAGRKQHKISMPNQSANGPEIKDGPSRGEACQKAASEKDIMAFSAAMYWTGYYEGFGPSFKSRIEAHAKAMNNNISSIASALGEPQEATIKSDNIFPITNDTAYLKELQEISAGTKTSIKQDDKNPKATTTTVTQNPQAPIAKSTETEQTSEIQEEQKEAIESEKAIEKELWFS